MHYVLTDAGRLFTAGTASEDPATIHEGECPLDALLALVDAAHRGVLLAESWNSFGIAYGLDRGWLRNATKEEILLYGLKGRL